MERAWGAPREWPRLMKRPSRRRRGSSWQWHVAERFVALVFAVTLTLPAAGAAAAPVQVVVAENHGVMFCHGCDDPLREGSYVPALTSFYSPSGYFVMAELVYGVPNRGDVPLYNTDEVRGRVALFDRGKVPFARKVQHAQQAGAVGVIIVENASCDDQRELCFEERITQASAQTVNGDGSTTVFENDPYIAWRGVRIPSVLISAADGERLTSFMALETFELHGETHFINDV